VAFELCGMNSVCELCGMAWVLWREHCGSNFVFTLCGVYFMRFVGLFYGVNFGGFILCTHFVGFILCAQWGLLYFYEL